MNTQVPHFYDRTVLRHPAVTLLVIAAIALTGAWFAQDFGLDATTDSLTLESDADLDYYRSIKVRYGSDDMLIVTFTPHTDLFGDDVLRDLGKLRDELSLLSNVQSVTSILDVPLLQSPPVSLQELSSGIRRLNEADTDVALARRELLSSPLYKQLMISADAQTTAILVDFLQDAEYLRLRDVRDLLREKRLTVRFTPAEAAELKLADQRFQAYAQTTRALEREQIAAVRKVLADHISVGILHLGGVPMIIADSIEFIRHDLILFGSAVLIFLIIILSVAFRRPRWVIVPLVTCLTTCVLTLGFLGFMGWRVTIVSSNFISLLLILCLALTLHIIVRYREIHTMNPEADQFALVQMTVRRVFVPCLYTALTTMVAFGSLVVSGIGPITDFGWMMVIGIAIAFVLSFTLFPACLLLLRSGEPAPRNAMTEKITTFFYNLIVGHSTRTLAVFLSLAVISIVGTTRLTVENRFIDYYDKSTEIYRGMEIIDRKLGGTVPLDVIIDVPASNVSRVDDEWVEDEFEDIYGDDPDEEAGITATSYWFNRMRLVDVLIIHDYLDGLPETGKVISIATAARVLEKLDPTILQDNLKLSLVYKRLPDDVKAALFDPYLSDDGNQLRFSIRVFDSDPTLRRAELIRKIRQHLTGRLGLDDEQVHLTGMLVLYNNMLESLFRSQILTLGVVFFAIMLMFLALFRSLRVAMISITPNMVSAAIVLGLMGWTGVSLDLMTITIAAITIGIGVDNTIHYVHRFEVEFGTDRDYWAAIRRCHTTVGRAIYYTSVTVILGFSILALSRFVPTIYFGLLTGLAMLIALLANMTLLPVLIAKFHAGEAGGPKDRPK